MNELFKIETLELEIAEQLATIRYVQRQLHNYQLSRYAAIITLILSLMLGSVNTGAGFFILIALPWLARASYQLHKANEKLVELEREHLTLQRRRAALRTKLYPLQQNDFSFLN